MNTLEKGLVPEPKQIEFNKPDSNFLPIQKISKPSQTETALKISSITHLSHFSNETSFFVKITDNGYSFHRLQENSQKGFSEEEFLFIKQSDYGSMGKIFPVGTDDLIISFNTRYGTHLTRFSHQTDGRYFSETLIDNKADIRDISISSDGNILLFEDSRCSLYELQPDTHQYQQTTFNGRYFGGGFLSNGDVLIYNKSENKRKNSRSETLVKKIKETDGSYSDEIIGDEPDGICKIIVSPISEDFVTISSNGKGFSLWERQTDKKTYTRQKFLENNILFTNNIAFLKNGDLVVVYRKDHHITFIKLTRQSDGKYQTDSKISQPYSSYRECDISPDGRISVYDQNNTLHLLNFKNNH